MLSLVRFASASRSVASVLPVTSICMTLKFPFEPSVLPLSLLGTGFRMRPSRWGFDASEMLESAVVRTANPAAAGGGAGASADAAVVL